jgi:uncharacterized protein (TIGR02118 family)
MSFWGLSSSQASSYQCTSRANTIGNESTMTTVFIVYNAKDADAKAADEYEKYLKEKKVALVRSQPYIKSYEIYRIDKVLGAEDKPPYQFVAKLEISDMGEFAKAMQSPEMQAFVKEYRTYLESSPNIWTIGHKIEP